MPLFGGKSVPLQRSLKVLWFKVGVPFTHIELGIGIPLSGKGPKLTPGSCVVLIFVRMQTLLKISTPQRSSPRCKRPGDPPYLKATISAKVFA
jgi:hypothetical protein